MLLAVTLSLLSQSPELPEVCRPPATRDVGPLTELAQRSGAVSVGLDSIATWCFDAAGTWTGGALAERGASAPSDDEPAGDCRKAVDACRAASAALSQELTTLLLDALGDLARPFLGAVYQPRRSGLAERPPLAMDCSSRRRSALSAQAQARMDWARLASQAQSEYANYRTWLFSQGLECAEALRRRAPADPTRRGHAVDRLSARDGGRLELPPAAEGEHPPLLAWPESGSRSAGTGPASVAPLETGEVAVGGGPGGVAPPTMLATWQLLAAERASLELDGDWTSGFLASRELRECRCTPVAPSEVLRRLGEKERLEALVAEDERNVRCERCLQDAYIPWKMRSKQQCALMARLTDYELGVLERSDDGNGLPQRCFDVARARRARADAGTEVATAMTGSTSSFIITRGPSAPAPKAEAAPSPVPLPEREPGRSYLRLFMSASCVADVEPGPLQLRTGDLLPVPLGVASLRVTSPCGGLAEVFIGTEDRPRVSETFGKDQPLELRFSR